MGHRQENESEQQILKLIEERMQSMVNTHDKHIQELMNLHKNQIQTLLDQHDTYIKELLDDHTELAQEPQTIKDIVSDVIMTLKPISTTRIPSTTANIIVLRDEMEQLNNEDLKDYATKLSKSVTSYKKRYDLNDEKFKSKRDILEVMEANLTLAKTINRERVVRARTAGLNVANNSETSS
jgi:hypothetical protein